jgi:heptosyltransferase-2
VVRFSSLGDILLTAPAFRALRKRFADAEICFLVAKEYVEAAAMIPGPDRVLTFDRSTGLAGLWRLREALSRRFSIFVDLQNSARSAFLRQFTFPVVWTKAKRYRLKRWLFVRFKWNLYRKVVPVPIRYLLAMEILGVEDDERGLELRVPDEARALAAKLLEQAQNHPVIALCPGARHFTKRWPKERWIELGRQLQGEGTAIAVFGENSETELVNDISSSILLGIPVIDHSISEVAAIMEKCDVIVSNDSGLMHLAAGVGTPVVGIFGPTVKEFGFFPFRARSEALEHHLNCRPCSAMGTKVCKEKHFRCMMDTTPQMVLEAVHRVRSVRKQVP